MFQFTSPLYLSVLGPILVARLRERSKPSRDNPEDNRENGGRSRRHDPKEKK